MKEIPIGMPNEEIGTMTSLDAVEPLPTRTPSREMDGHLREEEPTDPHQAAES